MPRYFFDLDDGAFTQDEVGVELRDLAAARKEAIRALTETAMDELPDNGNRKRIAVVVREGDGPAVLSAEIKFDLHIKAS